MSAIIMSGKRLNELLSQVRALTPLNAAQTGGKGWGGVAEGSAKPPAPLRGSFAASRMYVVTPALMNRLNAALSGRTPLTATEAGPGGFRSSSEPGAVALPAASDTRLTTESLARLQRHMRSITPLQTAQKGPNGYRLAAQSDKEAGLLIERQDRVGYAKVCSMDLADPESDGFVTGREITWTFGNGSYQEIFTAAGTITPYSPGDPEPDPCPDVEYENTAEDGFVYTPFVSRTETDTTFVGTGEASAAAIGAIADSGDLIASEYTWPSADFRAVSEATYSIFLGYSGSNNSISLPGWVYTRPRYRLTNTGSAWIKVGTRWFPSGSEPGDPGAIIGSVSLAPGLATDWIDAPAAAPLQSYTGRVDRVRLGRFLRIA